MFEWALSYAIVTGLLAWIHEPQYNDRRTLYSIIALWPIALVIVAGALAITLRR